LIVNLCIMKNTTAMNRLKGLPKVWSGELYTNKMREIALLGLVILAGMIISNILGV